MTEANKDYEWSRQRIKREKDRPKPESRARVNYLLNVAKKNNGDKAVRELRKEFGI